MGVAHSYCYELLTVSILTIGSLQLMHFDGMALHECKVAAIVFNYW